MSSFGSMSDFGITFDIDALVKDDQKSTSMGETFYRPNIIKEGISNYEAVLKFIYNPQSANESIINKYTVWLKNPSSEQAKYIDCPSSVKQKSVLQDAFFACHNSEKFNTREKKEFFKRNQQFFSLVQIVQDKQHPELEGQIRVFQYGTQVYNKIISLIKPDSEFKEANNPFDVFNGHLFHLNIKTRQVGKSKMPNYDDSEFLSKSKGLVIDNKEYTTIDKPTFEKIDSYLKEHAPDLNQFKYRDWNAETKQFVIDAIKSIIPPGEELNEIINKNKELFIMGGTSSNSSSETTTTKPERKQPKKTNKKPEPEPELEEDEFELEENDDIIEDSDIDDDDDFLIEDDDDYLI